MKKIEEIDKNLAIKKIDSAELLTFYDVCSDLFYMNGMTHDTMFRRMPESVAKAVSEGVYTLHTNTAGGSISFQTNSTRVAIKASMDSIVKLPHMPTTGVCGFDLYINNDYFGTFVPPIDIEDGYESMLTLPDGDMKNITINFPLYNNVSNLYVGLDKEAQCSSFNPYKKVLPVVYYGSSITQGGCASRPGMCYQSIIARKFGYAGINLGFSGSAKGEYEMARYLSELEMSVLVYAYDHNAPNAEYLKATHEPFFKIIREKNPNLPIIMMSQHDNVVFDRDLKRRQVVLDTYNNAKSSGDKNVYFIDGTTFFPNRDCTVDGTHPTDYGFALIAERIGKLIDEIINKKQ